jgi:glycosyltransferase involved in cell wall biosynthesis
MLEEDLELLIITYDRADDLEKTLYQLLESPFKKCKITILDNSSPDNTPQVCAKYKKLFSNMEIVRHKKNIGSSPNYLRAVELSNSKYTWILCDDDTLDFTDCLDVVDAIESEKYDIILLGEEYLSELERGLKTTPKELIDKGTPYYSTLGLITGFIFKTENFDTESIFKGYYNVSNIYPHFPFINKTFEKNYSVYISQRIIVHWGDENIAGFKALDIFISWLNCCQTIKDKKIRIKAIKGSEHYNGFMGLMSGIALEKIRKEGRSSSQIIFPIITAYALAFGFRREQLMLLMATVTVLTPSIIIKNLIKTILYFKYNIKGEKVPEKTYLYLFDEERYKRLH